MTVEKIIAMVVDETKVTFYRPSGTTIEIEQGTPGLKDIVDAVLPVINMKEIAEVDFSSSTSFANPYKDFQELAASAVQFFRVAKKLVAPFVAELIKTTTEETGETIAPVTAGFVPASSSMQSAVDAIMENAVPVTSDKFDDGNDQDDTVVAKVGDTIIPGVEKLKDQFHYAAKLGSPGGTIKLLERMAKYANKRQHSVEDLLRFMEKADLPIADDGSIIAYKVLSPVSGKTGVYVDKHTNKVEQTIGSFVCVDESLVDRDRRNECSNGLHIARRGYVGGFSTHGDVAMICKIAPEDVIVVPHNDPSKVRVSGYHILHELSPGAFSLLRDNKPMTSDPEVVEILSQIIAGNHIERTREVRITGQMGSGVRITKLINGKPAPRPKTKAKTEHTALDDATKTGKTLVKAKDIAESAAVAPRQQRARELMDIVQNSMDPAAQKKTAQQLLDFKRNAKVSWTKLGLVDEEVTEITRVATMELPKAPKKPKKAPPATKPTPDAQPSLSRIEQAQNLFKADDWAGLWAFKKKAKVSWMSLGFSNPQIEKIAKRKP